MVSSAEKNKSAMEGVSLESAQVLVELMADSATVERELLERRFSERARGFEETLKFMEGMRALTEREREIRRADGLDGIQEALRAGHRTFIEYITKLGVASATTYGKEIRGVLKAFRQEGGQAWLESENLRGKHYAARNLLLEAGAMRLDHENGTYTINNWFHSEFVRALYAHGTTPDELDKVVKDQAEIGLAAELQVYEYERELVGHRDAATVVHIALENTAAGFDIASTRREEETDQLRFRMIEVKAVSPREWAFTLTRNEIRVASENKEAYFLYLVPVIEGKPAVEKMEVIQNPVTGLLDKDRWSIREGDWSVSRVVRHG